MLEKIVASSWWSVLKVIPRGISLMTGVLGLVQSIVILYAANPDSAFQNRVFWALVWAAFVISSVLSWIIEHVKVRKLEAYINNSLKPDIKAEIVFKQVGVKEHNGREYTGITLVLNVLNSGASSPALRWGLDFEEPAGRSFKNVAPTRFETLSLGGELPMVLHAKDFLPDKTFEPLVRGRVVTGHLSFFLPIPRDSVDWNTAQAQLLHQDFTGRQYQTEIELMRDPGSGAPPPMLPYIPGIEIGRPKREEKENAAPTGTVSAAKKKNSRKSKQRRH